MMHHVHNQQCPSHISDMVMPVNSGLFRRRLHSADNLVFAVPITRTRFADHLFTVAGPVIWNSLPASVKSSAHINQFRKRLKTHVFSLNCTSMMILCDIVSTTGSFYIVQLQIIYLLRPNLPSIMCHVQIVCWMNSGLLVIAKPLVLTTVMPGRSGFMYAGH